MNYPLTPIGKATITSVAIIVLLLPVVVIASAYLSETQDPLRASLIGVAVGIVIGLALVLSLRRRSVRFDGHTLEVKAAFYTRRTSLGDLDVDGARIVDLEEHTELRPILRMNGYSLPGFHAGHYRLRNTRKAFALLTARQRVLAVPERSGTLLLLSLERPQALLDALRAAV